MQCIYDIYVYCYYYTFMREEKTNVFPLPRKISNKNPFEVLQLFQDGMKRYTDFLLVIRILLNLSFACMSSNAYFQ